MLCYATLIYCNDITNIKQNKKIKNIEKIFNLLKNFNEK